MEIKEAFFEYQYNKRLYDIIIQNISGKSFDLKENYRLEFSEASVEGFGLDPWGNIADSAKIEWYWTHWRNIKNNNNTIYEIIKVPFGISKFAPNSSTIRLRKLENNYSYEKCLYLFVWMISDGYIYSNTSYWCDINNVYKTISSEIMEVYDFIANLKSPDKLINIKDFKFNMPLK